MSGIGPVEPLTRAAKEALRSAVATARVVSAERMKVLLVSEILIRDSGLGIRDSRLGVRDSDSGFGPTPSTPLDASILMFEILCR
jgi:hypothetical protein